MNQRIAHIALIVDDYDKAIEFYTTKLRFTLVADTPLTATKRWVFVAPPGSEGPCLLLAKADDQRQLSRVGDQTGGRVFLFLYTDDFQTDFQNLRDQNVKIVREPVRQPYGTVAVFADLYGNLWDLIEPAKV